MSEPPETANQTADTASPDDSLALLAGQDKILVNILEGWDAFTLPPDVDDPRALVRAGFKRGTYGKLLIKHVALRVAAKADVARVLHEVDLDGLADDLTRYLPRVRGILDRLDEMARGVEATGVAASVAFAGAVGELAAVIRADLDLEPERAIPRIAAALGSHRAKLHSARWVKHHAPTHPSPQQRWYERIPPLVRVQASYDHLRGFPWADSGPMSDSNIAEHIDKRP